MVLFYEIKKSQDTFRLLEKRRRLILLGVLKYYFQEVVSCFPFEILE